MPYHSLMMDCPPKYDQIWSQRQGEVNKSPMFICNPHPSSCASYSLSDGRGWPVGHLSQVPDHVTLILCCKLQEGSLLMVQTHLAFCYENNLMINTQLVAFVLMAHLFTPH